MSRKETVMEVYLDNSATTRCLESVKEIVVQAMMEGYGNPSSLHQKGVEAEKYIKTAKERICRILKANEREIFFTSGGTESNNLAIIGTAMANKRSGMHLITSKIEHASVKGAMQHLEEQGFRVTYLSTDSFGRVDLKELEEAVCEETILVSIMHVNNEIGTIQPIEEISKIVKKKNPRAYVHVDSVQGFGKLSVVPKRMGIDLLSASGHKIHGPKGVGFLYVKDKVKIKPILFGGGQQKDLRSGTENVPGIAGLGQAAMDVYENLNENTKHMFELRTYFIEQLHKMEDVSINGYEDENNAPHIVSASFGGVRSEVLLHALEESNIYVSSGSACASNKRAASATLEAIGLSKEKAEGTVRFSFSQDTTKEQLDYCIERLQELLVPLRRFQRR